MSETHKIAGVSSDAVEKATGKNWRQWLMALDKLGARDMAHKSIAELLRAQHKLDGWWAQMITVGYEQSRGLRQVLEHADGFAASISRTVNTQLGVLYEAFAEETRRLEQSGFKVRRAGSGKAMRVQLDDGTRLEVNLSESAGGKSKVAVEHSRLKSAEDAQQSKAFWKQTLDELQEKLSRLG